MNKKDIDYLKKYFLPQIQTAENDREILSVLKELWQLAYTEGVADTDKDFKSDNK